MALPPFPDRYFICNFFEPVPSDEEFKKRWVGAANYVKNDEHYLGFFLHKSNDPDTKFPWVNFAGFNSDDVCVFGKPDPKWDELTGKKIGSFESTVKSKANPAGYREVASFNGNPLVAEKRCADTARYFFTAVTVRDSISDEDFEKNWKDWSGTNFLVEKGKEHGMEFVDSLLYRRFTTNMSPRFRYTVRTEVSNMSDTSGHETAKEFNNRKCVEGVETITGFYTVLIKDWK